MLSYKYQGAQVNCLFKYILFTLNIIFWVAGAGLLAITFWAWNEKGVLNIQSITELKGFDPVWVVLVVGSVTFILGFAGCIGALRENICLLKFFSITIGTIFTVELVAGILAFVFQDTVKEHVQKFIRDNIKVYRDDIDLQNLIDAVQKYMQCCGAAGPDDWNSNLYFNCSKENTSRERCGVPFSCCLPDPAEPSSELFSCQSLLASTAGPHCPNQLRVFFLWVNHAVLRPIMLCHLTYRLHTARTVQQHQHNSQML
ncbi:tetraspanin-5-like isoform X4 [Chiloscyllium plagiosum]|uniref:tetraspanin-5-like isoform X4 n=1 Tax=Chiloscyllium plagiosum TaxID=36176 RepID=UPI001CB83C8B|nr:tetraspanin-5-like isoform X4 [Chiloscyllium plagiosum]